MVSSSIGRRTDSVVLGLGLFLCLLVFGIRFEYPRPINFLIPASLMTLLFFLAWRAGAAALWSSDSAKKTLATAGVLLIGPWIVFTLLAGYSAPPLATTTENLARYLVLMINSTLIAGGAIMLRESLVNANERFFSSLGIASNLFAFTLYVVFTIITLVEFRMIAQDATIKDEIMFRFLDDVSVIMLITGALLLHLGSVFFATALNRAGWISAKAQRVFCAFSLLAALLVAIKLASVCFDPKAGLWSMESFYTTPGTILSIPAIPWIIPTIFGVLVLSRASKEKVSA